MTYKFLLRIDDDQEKSLRAFAAARNITLSAAVRIILYDRLHEEEEKP